MNFSYFKKHTPDELPDWFLIANKNAAINTVDVWRLFKYTDNALKASVKSGTFPQADFVAVIKTSQAKLNMPALKKLNNHFRKSQWKKKTIEDEINRRQTLLTKYINKKETT